MDILFYKLLSIILSITLGISLIIIISMYLDNKVLNDKLSYYINEKKELKNAS